MGSRQNLFRTGVKLFAIGLGAVLAVSFAATLIKSAGFILMAGGVLAVLAGVMRRHVPFWPR